MNLTVPEIKTKIEEDKQLTARPPIVVVMGHIDHGKTRLLDYIRKSKVAEKEAGGITQAIGAYQIDHNGNRITFIDTPGHESFSAMRIRGSHVADIAVLVTAADEGVKPQTEESIRTIQQAELPFIVAITKVDKPNADPNRVKAELAEKGVLVEGYGGNVPVAEVSATTGQGIEGLLETILLIAELEELATDPTKGGEGVIIESHLDPRRGAAATLLIEDGTVKRGDFIAVGGQVAPVRIFENFLGKALEQAGASEPIRIVGFAKPPELGERFTIFKTRDEAEKRKRETTAVPKIAGAVAGTAKTIVNIILKADVLGSKEAVEAVLAGLCSPELACRILKSDVGDITESDAKLAASSQNTFIVGFKVKIPPAIKELAERSRVSVVIREVIYDLIDEVKKMMVAMAPAELKRIDLGRAKILALFKEDKGKQIVGGRVESGKIQNNAKFDIIRNSMKIGAGRILSLQSQRRDTEEVNEGQEFGILTDPSTAIAAGDILEIFNEEKVVPQL